MSVFFFLELPENNGPVLCCIILNYFCLEEPDTRTSAFTSPEPDSVLCCSEQEAGSGGGAGGAEDQQTVPGLTAKTPSAPLSSGQGVLHLPSAAVCVGVLPGLWVYSGSSDSDSSSDSEGSVDAIMLPYPRHSRAYR